MTDRSPRVFTIPASVPFVPTLIAALRDGILIDGFSGGRDPLALAAATFYLPTRRACRLVRDVFLDVTGADAAILPRIVHSAISTRTSGVRRRQSAALDLRTSLATSNAGCC
jgi:ATP-dependent helicase/nuclease subunit B